MVYKIATKKFENLWDKTHVTTDFQNTELPVNQEVHKSWGAISSGRLNVVPRRLYLQIRSVESGPKFYFKLVPMFLEHLCTPELAYERTNRKAWKNNKVLRSELTDLSLVGCRVYSRYSEGTEDGGSTFLRNSITLHVVTPQMYKLREKWNQSNFT